MIQNIDAVYENGTFRTVGDAGLPFSNGTRERLSVESLESADTENVLEMAAGVYAGLPDKDIADVESIAC